MCVARGIPRFFVSFIKKRKGAFILVLFSKKRKDLLLVFLKNDFLKDKLY